MTTEVLEELNLSQGTFRQNLLAEDIGDLLYGNAFVGLCICSRTSKTKLSAYRHSIMISYLRWSLDTSEANREMLQWKPMRRAV